MLTRTFGWLFKALLAFLLLSILWVFAYLWVPPPATATMLANGDGITRSWRSLDDIDPDMARAVIAGEDSKFCVHNGFDRAAIEDAWSRYRKGGRIRGGSTISQQTAKNAFLWQGGGFFRKGLEAWFTFLVESMWSKRRIMEVYLNVAETGIGTYGVEAGAQRYFRHGSQRMTPTEAARIAAVLPLPKKRGAVAPTGFTRRYGNSILARMGVVRSEGLDDCLRLKSGPGGVEQPVERVRGRRSQNPDAALEALVPEPDPLPPDDGDAPSVETTIVEEEVPAETETVEEELPPDMAPDEPDPEPAPPDDPAQP